jgi:type VI secretion system protein ImpK
VLASQLRHAVVDAPEGLKPDLADAVQRFEQQLAAAGWDERGLSAASYLLCAWLDEVVADTPWGGGGAGLLQRFHGEPAGSVRVLRLLARLAERPEEHRDLLSLFHTCLSLGLHGSMGTDAAGRKSLEQLRARVFLTLPRAVPALSLPAEPAVQPGPRAWRRRLALAGLLVLGGATLGVYTAAHLMLASQVDEVFASMQQLADSPAARTPAGSLPEASAAAARTGADAGAGSVQAASPAASEGPARLRPALAADASAGRLSVRDEAHRSTVSVPAEQLFDGSGVQLAASAAPLVARIGAALAAHPGKVVVIGHTDGSDRRTARLPSAWHQSYEWARETANALGRSVPPQRLAIEGAADQDRPGGGLPRRRVDIVLYP